MSSFLNQYNSVDAAQKPFLNQDEMLTEVVQGMVANNHISRSDSRCITNKDLKNEQMNNL